MRHLLLAVVLGVASQVAAAQSATMAVPGGVDSQGRKVLTFIGKEPPGQRCNGNLQVAAEIANVYRVPIQVLPASLAFDGIPKLRKTGLLYNNKVRQDFETLKATIKSGGK